VTSHVGPEQRASAVGLLSVFLIIGQIVGGSLGGGVAGSHGNLVAGYRIAYLDFAGVALVALLLAAALSSRRAERARARAQR
jgi:MFS family permease